MVPAVSADILAEKLPKYLVTTLQFNDYEIYFIARGEHLRAIKQNGIVVKTPDRTISAKPNSGHRRYRRNSIAGFNFTLCEKL